MCTLTWAENAAGYNLYFNRDESVLRKPALPPSLHKENRVRYLAPTDADAGGTWIGVNEYGISVAILNYYQGTFDPSILKNGSYKSRGIIVRQLLGDRDSAEIDSTIKNLILSQFLPFQIIVFVPRKRVVQESPENVFLPDGNVSVVSFLWTGLEKEELTIEQPVPPVSSSGFEPEIVLPGRQHLFQQQLASYQEHHTGTLDNAFFYAYHGSHIPEKSAQSVCMHRHDARTVSFTHISIEKSSGRINYSPTALCKQNGSLHFYTAEISLLENRKP